MQRIMIMHISNISGHRSAGMALEKALKTLSPTAKVLNINAFRYISAKAEKIANFFYMALIQRAPFIWNYLYDNPLWLKRTEGLRRRIHRYNVAKVKRIIDAFRPDAIVCTQAFPNGLVAYFKQLYKRKLILVAALTDYTPHSYWIYDNVDYFIVACSQIKDELVKKGVRPEKILTLGIPIEHKFNQHVSKAQARSRLGLASDDFTILIMGGAQGLGPIKDTIFNLDKSRLNFTMLVVCGNNTFLYQQLIRQNMRHKIKIFGYVENVNLLMSAADLLVSKPGGITSAEAQAKGLPLIILRPLPGQEARNTAYLLSQGAAVKAENPKGLQKIAEDLISNAGRRAILSERAKQIGKPNAALDIARLLLEL